ncbi:ABC transporter ATP-binding protein [Amycolatopsis sp. NBC_01307]|uniref:ABC transporter ATP-binding protein n=1 Tax=Amycolatopsis sp. NBC_01307 TaxID=2903561 RepID=UPI002E161CE6|nr:ABC transporter ATP-binding protein [Amycolatopsis sp. NBC_01307]
MSDDVLLEVRDLTVAFGAPAHTVTTDVSLSVCPGGILGVVGESGSGKTVLCRTVLGLLPVPGRVVRGDVRFRGRSLLEDPGALSAARGSGIGYVPQNSAAALNPVRSVRAHLVETLRAHGTRSRRAVAGEAGALLETVGLVPAVGAAYPHELSGGMRQRVLIALALAPRPAVLLADEPTSALDVVAQRRILDLLAAVSRERGTAMVLVSHDIGVIRHLCHRVVVLYAGRVVEAGPATAVLDEPAHPYTRGLLAALPRPAPGRRGRLAAIPGAAPAPGNRPAGCVFRDRCPVAVPRCGTEPPARRAGPGHVSACHLVEEVAG